MKDRHERWVIGAGKYNQELFEQRQNEYLKYPNRCLFCNETMPYIALAERKERKFCNKSCACKFNNKTRLESNNFYQKGLKKETNCSICLCKITIGKNASIKTAKCKICKDYQKNIINLLKPNNKDNVDKIKLDKVKLHINKIKICNICNIQFETFSKNKTCCSDKCCNQSKKKAGSLGGRISASKNIKRSKDEISLYDLCKMYFKSVRHNEIIKDGWDADIIIDDYKLAILWNGRWHYEQLSFKNHSLKQVQTRDKIKTNVLESNGWKVIVFRDDEYTPNTAFKFLKENYKGK